MRGESGEVGHDADADDVGASVAVHAERRRAAGVVRVVIGCPSTLAALEARKWLICRLYLWMSGALPLC